MNKNHKNETPELSEYMQKLELLEYTQKIRLLRRTYKISIVLTFIFAIFAWVSLDIYGFKIEIPDIIGIIGIAIFGPTALIALKLLYKMQEEQNKTL